MSIDNSHAPAEFSRDGTDVAIRRGFANWGGLNAEPLLTETLVPVCSPLLLERLRDIPLHAVWIGDHSVMSKIQQRSSQRGEGQRAPAAMKECRTQPVFKRLYAVANGARSDAELLRRSLEIQVPSCSFE